MGIFNFLNSAEPKGSALAAKMCKEDPARAMNIALGEESVEETISAFVYAKVCNDAEAELKARVEGTPEYDEKMEICMQLGNAHKNRKISTISQKLNLRNKDQFIEIMKGIVDARIKALEEERGKTYEEIIEEEVNMLKKEMDKPNLSSESPE